MFWPSKGEGTENIHLQTNYPMKVDRTWGGGGSNKKHVLHDQCKTRDE